MAIAPEREEGFNHFTSDCGLWQVQENEPAFVLPYGEVITQLLNSTHRNVIPHPLMFVAQDIIQTVGCLLLTLPPLTKRDQAP